MHACLTYVGLLFLSQVTGTGGSRYPESFQGDQFPYNSAQNVGEDATSTPPAPPESKTLPSTYGETSTTEQAKPLPKRDGQTGSIKPSQLLESLAKRPNNSQLDGVPLTLTEALLSAKSRAQQSRVIDLYWKLSNQVLEYDLGLRELTELSMLQEGILNPGPAWDQARDSAQATLRTKLKSAQALRYQLQRELGLESQAVLPLPKDLPYCGEYQTRYEEIFSGRDVPEAQELAELLSLEFASLKRQVEGVASSRQWLDTVSAQRSSQSDGSELLSAYESFARSRRIFLQSVKDYNNHISRYTELVAPVQVGTNRLVAMLIKTKNLQWERNSIQQATAEEPLDHGESGNPLRRTYSEAARFKSQRIPIGNGEREHSILVE